MPFGLWISLDEIEDRVRSGDPKSVAYALSKSARWVVGAGWDIKDNPRKGECTELLIPLLDSAEENVRANTLHALWGIAMHTSVNPRALKPVAARLRDRSLKVRKNAAMVLANWADATISDALLASLRDPDSEVRLCCAAGLAHLHDLRALSMIEESVQAGEAWGGSNNSLEQIFPPDRLVQLYISMLDNRDISTGLEGLWRMVANPNLQAYTTPAIRPLIDMLGRSLPSKHTVKPEGILLSMRQDEAAEELLEQLSKERNSEMRFTLLNIISQLKVPLSPRLIQAQSDILINEDLNLELRLAAAERLIESGRTRTAEILLTILKTPGFRRSGTEREALRIGDLIAACGLDYLMEPLLDLTADAYAERAAVWALGGYADPRAITALINYIAKPLVWPDRNKFLAAEALGKIYRRRDLTSEMRLLIEANRRLLVGTVHMAGDHDEPDILAMSRDERQAYEHGAWSNPIFSHSETRYLEDFLSGDESPSR